MHAQGRFCRGGGIFFGGLGAALVTDFGWARGNFLHADNVGKLLSWSSMIGSYGYRVDQDSFKEKGKKWEMVKPEIWCYF